jgi:SAM-dependent methyltransferase
MDDRIGESRAYWDRHARKDPMWAVLSDPAKQGRRWDLQGFMRNGEREIALLWNQLAQLQLVPDHHTALDFGCGIGRLTQALARRFDRVVGVDISPSMVAVARDIDRYPSIVDYMCNPHSDLRDLHSRSCDFIYSNIVLQHVVPQLSIEYLKEFFRLLKPGGVLVFQLPSHQEPLAEVTTRPMPDDAYRAQIKLTTGLPATVTGAELLATLRLTNTSSQEWRQRDFGSIRVGNHWFDSTGRYLIVQDDGRAVLPQVLKPGESCDIVLPMVAPSAPGSYQGEIDVVHEGVTWFRDKGSTTVRFDMVVPPRGSIAPERSTGTINELPVPDYREDLSTMLDDDAATTEQTDPFPMHGVPREHVTEIIGKHGGTLVRVEDGLRAGVEWVDYRYFVRAR